MNIDQEFQPTLPSLATRKPSLRGRGSFRGALVATIGGQRRAILFESRLELMTAYVWLTRPDVVDFRDQYPIVKFKVDGKPTKHTFDFFAVLSDGRRIGLACKRKERADETGFRRFLGLIADQCSGLVDEVRLVTERSFSRTEVRNAELMHHMAHERDPSTDAQVARHLAGIVAPVSIGEIVAATGLGGQAYRAIVRAIYHGHCTFVGGGPLGYSSMIAGGVL